jgi:uncharacterized membrane protein
MSMAVHRFLVRSSFYPLMLCTLLCASFLLTRAVFMRHWGYTFLVKNLFLAWTPFLLSAAVVLMVRKWPAARLRILGLAAAWLAMLPNAPYILTDMIHWRNRREMPWWFDLGLVLMFALTGCFVGIVSLRMMHDLVRQRFGEIAGWAFVTMVSLLTGFGIYLGRFERWNSWDLLTRPHRIFFRAVWNLTNPYLNDRTLGVTLMFGAIVLACYVMVVSVNGSRTMPEARS